MSDKWTKEPWRLRPQKPGSLAVAQVLGPPHPIDGGDYSPIATPSNSADAARIVACVNACAAIRNPEAIGRAVKALEASKNAINALLSNIPFGNEALEIKCREINGEAHAAAVRAHKKLCADLFFAARVKFLRENRDAHAVGDEITPDFAGLIKSCWVLTQQLRAASGDFGAQILNATRDGKYVMAYQVNATYGAWDGWWDVEALREAMAAGWPLDSQKMTAEQRKAIGVFR